GDSVYVVAARLKMFKRADQFLSALIGHASASQHNFNDGPAASILPAQKVAFDIRRASEFLPCALPSAANIPMPFYTSGALMRMLKQTKIAFDPPELVLLAYTTENAEVIVGKQRFSVKYLDAET